MITYKVRIYPTKKQREYIDDILWKCKEFYNSLLETWNIAYKVSRKGLGLKELESLRKEMKEDLREVPAQVQQQVVKRLVTSYDRFFKKLGNHPKFKSIHKFRSIVFPQIGSNCKILLDSKQIQFALIGKVQTKFDRPILGTPKQVILKKMPSEKYYAFIVVDNSGVRNTFQHDPNKMDSVGIDLGIEKFATLSDGTYVRTPSFMRRNKKKLSRAQRKLSRKKLGSRNRNKQRIKVARLHEKITNSRNDFHWKVAKHLATKYGTICVEDLSSSFMIRKNQRKSKSMAICASDLAFYNFLVKLHYQTVKYGCKIIDVNPHGTSQTCSNCGATVRKDLNVRTHSCPDCGFVCDRDLNASYNILKKGLPGCNTPGAGEIITLVETRVTGVGNECYQH